ncbi:MAG: CbiX/SirB N-terminal domain-containing protein [Planctomycetota bacterium]
MAERTGVIIVDHGSRRPQSNLMLERVAELFGDRFAEKFDIVEPAHMELAMPDIEAAYGKCVDRGASKIVVLPFFLGHGKHFTKDIPSLTNQASVKFPHTRYQIAEPLGIDDLILDLLEKRIDADDQPVIDAGGDDPRLADVEPSKKRVQCATCPFQLHRDGRVTIKPDTGVDVATAMGVVD